MRPPGACALFLAALAIASASPSPPSTPPLPLAPQYELLTSLVDRITALEAQVAAYSALHVETEVGEDGRTSVVVRPAVPGTEIQFRPSPGASDADEPPILHLKMNPSSS